MKPSKIKQLKIKYAWWLLKHFLALMWCGTCYTSKKDYVMTEDDTRHEMIHVRQAINTHDSWFFYYLTYCWLWICNLPLIFIDFYAPYKFNEMELEAYGHQSDLNRDGHQSDLNRDGHQSDLNRDGHEKNGHEKDGYQDIEYIGGDEWRKLRKKLSLKDKRGFAKQWYGDPMIRVSGFSKFVKEYIL